MKPKPVKRPRRIGGHVAAALDHIRALGGRDVQVRKTKHVQIECQFYGRTITVHTCCTPKCEDVESARLLRRIKDLFAEVVR